MEHKRITRRQAIIRRRIFVSVCAAILALVIALFWFIIYSVFSDKDKGDNNSSEISSVIESSSETSSLESSTPSSLESSITSSTESKTESDDSSTTNSTTDKKPIELNKEFSNLLLVNGKNPLPEGYDYTGKLMLIEDKYLCGWRNQLNSDVMPYATAMIEAAWADGVELYILSPYRSYDTQVGLFEKEVQKWIKTGMERAQAEEKASTIVARPGTSEHHTGLAIDFNSVEDSFEQTKMFKWLDKNAQNYGFILRYTEEKQPITGVIHESWHWRFVGINEAIKIKASGLCLEEYLENKGNN